MSIENCGNCEMDERECYDCYHLRMLEKDNAMLFHVCYHDETGQMLLTKVDAIDVLDAISKAKLFSKASHIEYVRRLPQEVKK